MGITSLVTTSQTTLCKDQVYTARSMAKEINTTEGAPLMHLITLWKCEARSITWLEARQSTQENSRSEFHDSMATVATMAWYTTLSTILREQKIKQLML